MTDPRVTAVADHLASMRTELGEPTSPQIEEFKAARILEVIEAAGLIVLADNDATVERIEQVLYRTYRTGVMSSYSAAAESVLAALRSSPPAGFPAAGGAPKDGADNG